MGKVSKKKISKNTKPTQKLSDIVPELAYLDTVKKQLIHTLFLEKARITARYAKEKKLSKDTKSKIRLLFWGEYTLANTYMRNFLHRIPDLSRDERNYSQKKLTEFYDKVKNLLFESLDNDVSNLHKFNELVREELNINQGLAFDADSYRGGGIIDKKTRVVKFPEPAETRQEKDGQSKTNITDYKALNLAKVPISKLIQQSESHTLEFKEIPECHTQQNRKNNDVVFSPLKTIAGFLNAEGGILLIGVDNSGKIVGIEPYLNTMEQGSNDTFEQQIRNCLRDRFEPYPIGKVKVSFEKFMEGTVCRIDVQADKEPVNLDNEIYVRDGNTTQLLKGRRLTDWIEQRRLLTALPSGK